MARRSRLIFVFILLLLLASCARPGDDYARGYAEGYAAGLAAASDSRALPAESAAPASSPSPTASPAADDFTVYVSRSGTMHKKPNCSGMTHYSEMPYSVASQYYDKKCGNCFK